MNNQGKKGSVLLYVIMIFCLMTVLGTGLVFLANHNTRMTQLEIDGEQTYQSALSGLESTLDAFVNDPVTGQSIVTKIRSGSTSISSDIVVEGMGNIQVTISCAPDQEQATCKKLQVVSNATYKELKSSAIGYLNIIEGGGLSQPVVLPNFDNFDGKGNGQNSQFCPFDTECKKGKDVIESDITVVKNLVNKQKYETFIKSKTDKLPKCNFNITSSCYIDGQSGDYIVNATSDIYIDMKSSIYGKITLQDSKSNNIVVCLVDGIDMYYDTNAIGSKEEDADNFLILNKSTDGNKSIRIVSTKKTETNIYGWIVHPFGSVSINQFKEDDDGESSLYGGVIANEFALGKFSNIYGVKPLDGMASILVEAGLDLGGAGGTMTFGKTYDK